MEVALCRDGLGKQILANYRALEKFDEGARFPHGRAEEAFTPLAAIRGKGGRGSRARSTGGPVLHTPRRHGRRGACHGAVGKGIGGWRCLQAPFYPIAFLSIVV